MKLHTVMFFITGYMCFLILIITVPVHSQELNKKTDNITVNEKKKENIKSEKKYQHVIRHDIPVSEQLLTLGFVYAIQWGYYVTFQNETIKDHGSFKNWYTNMYKPHFDYDSYDYNLILHTLTGTYYYLFFRSRGHTKAAALRWGMISQLLFEFTIETATERPSFQDMYQTPVFGAVVGMSLEYVSNTLLSTDSVIAHILGYLLNPFALFPFSSYETANVPIVAKSYFGYALSFRF